MHLHLPSSRRPSYGFGEASRTKTESKFRGEYAFIQETHLSLSQLNPLPERSLFLVAGQETMDYLAEYDNLEDLGLQHIRFIENSEIANPPSLEERRFAVRAASINYEERRLS